MKILIVGGNGTIGRKVSSYFQEKEEVIVAGRSSGDVQVDIADSGLAKHNSDRMGAIFVLALVSASFF